VQHVNLYLQLEKKQAPVLSARQQLVIAVALVAAMLLIYGVLQLLGATAANQLQNLQQTQQTLTQNVNQLRARKQALENDQPLLRELARLDAEINFRRELLSTIGQDGAAQQQGFAPYLAGLGRQAVNGLWFTQIEIDDGGNAMALVGETRQAELLPQYLQKLSDEPVFAGQQFSVLKMSAEPETRLLSFSVRARDKGEQP
jgi:cell division protein FtsB